MIPPVTKRDWFASETCVLPAGKDRCVYSNGNVAILTKILSFILQEVLIFATFGTTNDKKSVISMA